MEGEMIIVSLVSGIFAIIIFSLNFRFWTKKYSMNYDFEKFKYTERRKDAQQRKNLPAPRNPAPSSLLGNIGGLLPILQNLTPEQIDLFKGLVGAGGEETEETGGGGFMDGLLKFAEENPEVVNSFLGGLKRGTQKEQPPQEGFKGQV